MEVLDQLESDSSKGTARSIEDVLRNGYEFQFSNYLSRMFNLFGKTWANLLGHSGILFGTYVVVYFILIFLLLGNVFLNMGNINSGGHEPDEFASDFASGMITSMVLMFSIILIWVVCWVLPFRAGIYSHLNHGVATGSFEFNKFFEPIKTKWVKMIGLILLNGLVTYGLTMGFGLYMMQGFISDLQTSDFANEHEMIMQQQEWLVNGMAWILLGYLVMAYFAVASSLAVPLLLFQTDSIMNAFTSSLKIVTRKWFHFLALYIIVYLLTIAGVIACGVGMLLTIQFFPLVIFAIYEDIFIHQNQQ